MKDGRDEILKELEGTWSDFWLAAGIACICVFLICVFLFTIFMLGIALS